MVHGLPMERDSVVSRWLPTLARAIGMSTGGLPVEAICDDRRLDMFYLYDRTPSVCRELLVYTNIICNHAAPLSSEIHVGNKQVPLLKSFS
jgi:hypothetical protein